jgi:hypothetical protein
MTIIVLDTSLLHIHVTFTTAQSGIFSSILKMGKKESSEILSYFSQGLKADKAEMIFKLSFDDLQNLSLILLLAVNKQ